jgi:hypothetical protein
MAGDDQRGALFRPLVPNQHSRVTYAELFFDLVFVFAVTQISHTLLGRFTALGAVQTTLLFLAVWWVWVYTSWITNWLNPETTPVRVMLFVLMLGGLVLSTSIPQAFESRGLWFAIAYAAMQVSKTIFLWVSTPSARTLARLNAVRITTWLSVSGVFWIAGGFADGQARLVFWAVALGIEYLSPAVRFWIPKYGASSIEDWTSRQPHGRALRLVRHHRARRIHRRDRRDLRRSGLVCRDARRRRVELHRQPRDVVDLFPSRRGSRVRADFEIERAGAAGAACLYLPAHADRRRYHSFGGRRRTRAETSRRPFRSQDGAERDRRMLLFLLSTILTNTIRGWLQLSQRRIIALHSRLVCRQMSPLLRDAMPRYDRRRGRVISLIGRPPRREQPHSEAGST